MNSSHLASNLPFVILAATLSCTEPGVSIVLASAAGQLVEDVACATSPSLLVLLALVAASSGWLLGTRAPFLRDDDEEGVGLHVAAKALLGRPPKIRFGVLALRSLRPMLAPLPAMATVAATAEELGRLVAELS